jgi:hypothetical protein
MVVAHRNLAEKRREVCELEDRLNEKERMWSKCRNEM